MQCTFDEPYHDPNTASISYAGLALKILKICETGDVLFRFLTLPTVQTLHVVLYHNDDGDEDGDEDALPFISRLAKSLLNFSGPASTRVPVQCLFDMTALTNLVLHMAEEEYVAEFFDLLDRANHRNFLPQLCVLQLDMWPPYVNEFLVAALSSRAVEQDAGAQLRSFRQTWTWEDRQFRYDAEGDTAIALKKLVQNGMEIYLGMINPR